MRPAVTVCRKPAFNEELSRRITAKYRAIAARRAADIAALAAFAVGNGAGAADIDGPCNDPEALTMAVPYQPEPPFHVFEEYAFSHNGRMMLVYYNTISGDIGVARRCRNNAETDLFSRLMRRDLMLLATMSARDGLDRARVIVYHAEALIDKTAVRALAAIVRRKYPFVHFATITVLSEHLGNFTCSLDVFMTIALRERADADERAAAAAAIQPSPASATKPIAADAPVRTIYVTAD